MTRTKTLFRLGLKGSTVTGFQQAVRGRAVVTIEWREPNRRTKSWPMTAEGRRLAKAYAEGVVERLQSVGIATAQTYTVEQVFTQYVNAKSHEWRAATLTGHRNRWRIFEAFVGAHTNAAHVTPATLDELRSDLRKRPRDHTGAPMVPNQIQMVLALVTRVWRWAGRRGLLAVNVLADYENKLGRDDRPLTVPEYTPEEFAKILAALQPDSATGWRVYGVIALAGLTGKRERTLLSLRWSDIHEDGIHWRAETDKRGRAWVQPINADAKAVLERCRQWRARIGYTGDQVFPPVHKDAKGEHYTAASVTALLHAAEARAGVPSIRYRALHSFKRMVVRTLHDQLGGDLYRVGQFVGNTDERVLKRSYLQGRIGELDGVADGLTLPRTPTEGASTKTNEQRTAESSEI